MSYRDRLATLIFLAAILPSVLQAQWSDLLWTRRGFPSYQQTITISPDGMLAVTGDHEGLRFWDGTTGRFLRFAPGSARIVSFSGDGRMLAMTDDSSRVYLADPATGAHTGFIPTGTQRIMSMAISPDGRYLVTGDGDKGVKLWDVAGRTLVRQLTGTLGRTQFSFAPDGSRLACGDQTGNVVVYDLPGGTLDTAFRIGTVETILAIRYAPDGRRLAVVINGKLMVFDAATYALQHEISAWINGLWIAPEGGQLVAGGNDGKLRRWDLQSGAEGSTTEYSRTPVVIHASSSDGHHAIVGDYSGVMKMVDLTSGENLFTFGEGHTGAVGKAVYSSDGSRLASGGMDGGVVLWDAATGERLRTFQGHTAPVTAVAISRDGKMIASVQTNLSLTAPIRIWNAETGELLREIPFASGGLDAVAISPDGTLLATGGTDKIVRLWSVATGEPVETMVGHGGPVRVVAFSPDGNYVASGSDDFTVKLWNVSDGLEVRTLNGHTNMVYSLAFTPDGKGLVSGGWDKKVKAWELETGSGRTISNHEFNVYAVAVAPDGRWGVSSDRSGSIRAWRFSDGGTLGELGENFDNTYGTLAISPDSRRIASGTFNGTVAVWDAARILQTLSVPLPPDGPVRRLALYPNPAAVSATVSFTLDAPAHTTIRLYNMLGEEVATLAAERLGRGSYQRAVPLAGMAPGLYHCVLECDGVRTSVACVVGE